MKAVQLKPKDHVKAANNLAVQIQPKIWNEILRKTISTEIAKAHENLDNVNLLSNNNCICYNIAISFAVRRPVR